MEDFTAVANWFDIFKLIIKNYKITLSNLYNFNETGFIIRQGKEQAVITQFKEKSYILPSASNWESVTIIEYINVNRSVIPYSHGKEYIRGMDSLHQG